MWPGPFYLAKLILTVFFNRTLPLLNLEYPCNDDKLCSLGNPGTYLDKTVLTAGTSHRPTNVGGKKATQNLMTKTERMNSSTGPGMITSFAIYGCITPSQTSTLLAFLVIFW